MYSLVKTSSGSLALSTADIKLYMKVDDTVDDNVISIITNSVVENLENICNKSVSGGTWEFTVSSDYFKDSSIKLPIFSAKSITSIQGKTLPFQAWVTIPSDSYTFNPEFNEVYYLINAYNYLKITFTADPATDSRTKQLLLFAISSIYKNRDSFHDKYSVDNPLYIGMLKNYINYI